MNWFITALLFSLAVCSITATLEDDIEQQLGDLLNTVHDIEYDVENDITSDASEMKSDEIKVGSKDAPWRRRRRSPGKK